jgi:hypothetical protein
MVLGSIPGGVTGIFSDIFPSNCTMALGLTQPLVKMSTRNIPGGKGGWCVRLTTSPPSRAECHEIWDPLGHTGPVMALPYLYLLLLVYFYTTTTTTTTTITTTTTTNNNNNNNNNTN